MDYKTMTPNDIINYCKENNETEWLKKACKANNEGRRPSFFEIKKAFVDKFMPEIKPVAKPKKPTFYDLIDSL